MKTPPEIPVASTDALYAPTDVTPEEIFQAIGKLRKAARDEVDRLIRFLDKTDDYVSRELEVSEGDDEPDGGEEPSLGSADRMLDQTKAWVGGTTDPWTIDREKDDCDDEPSLGSVAVGEHRSQEDWTGGNTDDREDEHDGAEPDEDREPSLGALEEPSDQDVSWGGETGYLDWEETK